MSVTWGSVDTDLGDYLELTYFDDLDLVADYLDDPSVVDFFFLDPENVPKDLEIVDKTLTGFFIEMDKYVPEFLRPDDFSYDGDNKAGENYASYGSALARTKTFEFTIRAYHIDFYDSNMSIDSFEDKTFTILIRNDYSSTRDTFIKEYYEDTGVDGEDPHDFIQRQKDNGYYL